MICGMGTKLQEKMDAALKQCLPVQVNILIIWELLMDGATKCPNISSPEDFIIAVEMT